MIRVNLVPQDILDKEVQRLRAIQALAAAGVLLLFVGGVSLGHYRTKVELLKTLAQQQAELKRLEQIVAEVKALESQAAAVRSRLGVMDGLLVSREFYPRFMSHLLETFPAGVWINSLGAAPSGEGLTLSLASNARTVRDLLDWYRTLKTSELFSEPVIGTLTFDKKGGVILFPMTVKYAPRKVQS